MKITYKVGGKELLNQIEPLWEQLNQLHHEKSPYFKEKFEGFSYSKRMLDLLDKAEVGHMRIDLAEEIKEEKIVGYCISSINENGIGEIESLYVEPAYRGFRIGEQLIGNALEWLEDNVNGAIQIGVAVGNEEAFDFYRKFNFYPSVTLLRKIDK